MSDIVAREFRSPRSKLARARHHLADLETALAQFAADVTAERSVEPVLPEDGGLYERGQRMIASTLSQTPDQIRRALAPYVPPYAHRLYVQAPPLEDVNTIAADVVQNLRQALDHAACACARSLGRSDSQVYFPIRSGVTDPREAAIEANRVKEQTRKLPVSVSAIMQKSEPGGGILYELHKLGLADKHRIICQCACHASAQMRHMKAGPGWIVSGFGDDDWNASTNCLTYAMTSSPIELDYSFDFGIEVRLNASGIIATKPATAALNEIADAVDGIIGEIAVETAALLALANV